MSHSAEAAVRSDPVATASLGRFLSGVLETLLKLVEFEKERTTVPVNGFRLLQPGESSPLQEIGPEKVKKGYQHTSGFKRLDPRLQTVYRLLMTVANRVVLTQDGEDADVDGFHLRDMRHWLIPAFDNPNLVLDYLNFSCKVHCVFCYLDGNPEEFKTYPVRTPDAEIDMRLAYYQDGRAILPRHVSNNDEIVNHPRFLEVAGKLRPRTDKLFEVPTNGRLLDEKLIHGLSKLRPINVSLSLTSTQEQFRRSVVRDPVPKVAIESIELLQKYKVPYYVSLIAWPTLPLDDLEKSLEVIDSHEPHTMGVYYPGATRMFPDPIDRADADAHFEKVVNLVRRMRDRLATPIGFDIQKWEEIRYYDSPADVRLIGPIKNSPAFHAGLRWNDRVVRIENSPIFFRPQLQTMIGHLMRSGVEKFTMEVERGGKKLKFEVDGRKSQYPDIPVMFPYGLVVGAGLGDSDLRLVRAMIDAHGAKKVLILSTELVRPMFMKLAEQWNIFDSATQLHVEIPPNKFLGGNIFVGDLLVADDYTDYIREWMADNGKPDLVLIPSTPFTDWGRDLAGNSYLSIGRRTGVPVQLIPTRRMMN